VIAAGLPLAGCLNNGGVDPDGNPAVTNADVESITDGQWNGGTNFSGTWKLHTKVTKTNCVPTPGATLPETGEESDETVVLVQVDGKLTHEVDSIGEGYQFHGSISGGGEEGQFEYGVYYDLASLHYIEITTGTMKRPNSNELAASLTGTSRRHYQGLGVIDCAADMEVTGQVTLAGGATPDAGVGNPGGADTGN
jgi:hypothetical protein